MERLKASWSVSASSNKNGFNSSMERLKVFVKYLVKTVPSFQFQHGEIKSRNEFTHVSVLSFQFQHGEIKRCVLAKLLLLLFRFQFQHGEIKSKAFLAAFVLLGCFNSSMERLKVKIYLSKAVRGYVSIPAWRD